MLMMTPMLLLLLLLHTAATAAAATIGAGSNQDRRGGCGGGGAAEEGGREDGQPGGWGRGGRLPAGLRGEPALAGPALQRDPEVGKVVRVFSRNKIHAVPRVPSRSLGVQESLCFPPRCLCHSSQDSPELMRKLRSVMFYSGRVLCVCVCVCVCVYVCMFCVGAASDEALDPRHLDNGVPVSCFGVYFVTATTRS